MNRLSTAPLLLLACVEQGIDETAVIDADTGADVDTDTTDDDSDLVPGTDIETDTAPFVSTCDATATSVDCPYTTVRVDPGLGFATRDVHVATPLGTPPTDGWPAVLFFQGSLFSAELSFTGTDGAPFGQFHLARTVQSLLDEGFVVIAPEVLAGGSTFWQTNIPPFSVAWQGSSDDRLMGQIFDEIDNNGLFGPIDSASMYATGISSGGFMSSRMAVSYPGRFRALAIHSAGYATCSAVCLMPRSLPDDHPPTLFVHGLTDLIVPPRVMTQYRDALEDDGVEVDVLIGDREGHEWMAEAATAIPDWFLAH